VGQEGVAGGGGRWRGDLTNVQRKAIQNCHNKSPVYNEYMLIKMEGKKSENSNKYISLKFC
jgi:hypothetical protein